MSSRRGQARGRPRRAGAGNSGASNAHSASVRSQGYREPAYTGEHGIGVIFSDRWGLAVSGTHWGAWAPSGHIVGGGWDHSKGVLGVIVLSRAGRRNSQTRSQHRAEELEDALPPVQLALRLLGGGLLEVDAGGDPI